MRRSLVVTGIVLAQIVAGGVAVAADRFAQQPECSAYVTLGFGGPRTPQLPLHYGLMMRYDGGAQPLAGSRPPTPLLAMDFDAAGTAVAVVSGLPLVAHLGADARAARGQSPHEEADVTSMSGMMDWGLMGLGVAGVGYGLSQATGTTDQNAALQPGAGIVDGSLSRSLNLLSQTVAGVEDPAAPSPTLTPTPPYRALPDLMLLSGAPPLVFGACDGERPSAAYQHWLDGGTGHMGDLNPR